MNGRRFFILICALSLCAQVALFNQASAVRVISDRPSTRRQEMPEVGLAVGDNVVVVVPDMLTTERSTWSAYKLEILARASADSIEIWDPQTLRWRRDWQALGFPSTRECKIATLKTVADQKDFGDAIELSASFARGQDYRLYVPVANASILHQLVVPSFKSDQVIQQAYRILEATYFVGPLEEFTPEERLAMILFAHKTANGTSIGFERFKNLGYLTIDLPSDGSVWNDLRVSRNERVSHLISDELPLLKAFAHVAVRHEIVGGLRLRRRIRHGTAPSYSDIEADDVLAYFPMSVLLQFADADVTSQKLVDQSIILVNGDRVDVDLSKL